MFDAWSEQWSAAQELSIGGAAMIGVGAETLCTATFGKVRPGGIAVDRQTRFDLGALTTLLSPVMLALLALERGQVSLRDPLGLFMEAPADKRGLTLLRLLTNASGFPAEFLLEQEANDAYDALRAILAHPLAGGNGNSQIAAIVLGKVMESVYGLPLDEAAKKYVFQPLGMKHSGYLPSGQNIACAVRDADAIGVPRNENARFQHGVSGNAGVFADIVDCGRFAAMLANTGKTNGRTFLQAETLAFATRDHTPKKTIARGLGFQLAKRGSTFMGELWAADGFGLADDAGMSLAVEPRSGLWTVLLLNRANLAKDAERLASVRRRLHNAVCGEFRRG